MTPPFRRLLPLAPLAGLLAAGCTSRPYLSIEGASLEGTLDVSVASLAFAARVEVCGVTSARGQFARLSVPLDCILPLDLPIEAKEKVELPPIRMTVTPLVGAATVVKQTVSLDVIKSSHLVESWLHAVAMGKAKLPRPEGKAPARPGIAVVGLGGVRGVRATTVGEVDVVVYGKRVDERATGQECAYTGLVSGKLYAYDVELFAVDAHTGKKLGKKHLVNEHPACPSFASGRATG